MLITDWLAAATADAAKRNLPELAPLLEGLATSTTALRDADEAERRRADACRAPQPHGERQ
jgi:hypothetical protein